MLTPKVKPFFRLNFVEDILAVGRMLKLLLCSYSSRFFFWFWFSQEIGKTTGFGGLGEPPARSLTTENVQFRQISGQFEKQATTEKV
jgi:hypothetical protein